MRFNRKIGAGIAGALVLALLAVGVYFGVQKATTRTVTVYFPSLSGLYTGDPVRVIGVNIGKVSDIEPRTGDVKVTLRIDRDTPIPADARAVVVAQSLVSGRFVQLTPAFSGGKEMADGATIQMDHTAVPMEWDDVKKQLDDLTKAIGPDGTDPGTAVAAI
ncbi:MAG: MlaD family protein, partial [Gordonia sp. (in: high G+C Gram-positive bacteria)]